MPFDGNTGKDIYALRREALIDALENERFPEGFKWMFQMFHSSTQFDSMYLPDFQRRNNCKTAGCAIGLMSEIFDDFKLVTGDNLKQNYINAAKYLGITVRTSRDLFSTGYNPATTTAKTVAENLREVHAAMESSRAEDVR